MDFFNDGSYKFVTNMINEKIDVLKENGEFNEKYTRMYDLIDEFDLILEDNQKKKFNKIMELIYNTEERTIWGELTEPQKKLYISSVINSKKRDYTIICITSFQNYFY